MKKLYIYAMVSWLIILVLAVMNGISRDALYRPLIGDTFAHQISTLILVAAIFIVTYIFLSIKGLKFNDVDLIAIGVDWMLATVAFEFLFGYFVAGKSWHSLIADYNVFRGRMWPLVLICLLVAPDIVGRYLNKKK
jgi:hypothetical protein